MTDPDDVDLAYRAGLSDGGDLRQTAMEALEQENFRLRMAVIALSFIVVLLLVGASQWLTTVS